MRGLNRHALSGPSSKNWRTNHDDQISKQARRVGFNLSPLDNWLPFRGIAPFCGAHAEQNNPATAATFAYVANVDDDTVSVIDTARNALGNLSCKTEASQKPVPLDPELAKALLMWRRRSP